jgi:hypothetical protein
MFVFDRCCAVPNTVFRVATSTPFSCCNDVGERAVEREVIRLCSSMCSGSTRESPGALLAQRCSFLSGQCSSPTWLIAISVAGLLHADSLTISPREPTNNAKEVQRYRDCAGGAAPTVDEPLYSRFVTASDLAAGSAVILPPVMDSSC